MAPRGWTSRRAVPPGKVDWSQGTGHQALSKEAAWLLVCSGGDFQLGTEGHGPQWKTAGPGGPPPTLGRPASCPENIELPADSTMLEVPGPLSVPPCPRASIRLVLCVDPAVYLSVCPPSTLQAVSFTRAGSGSLNVTFL